MSNHDRQARDYPRAIRSHGETYIHASFMQAVRQQRRHEWLGGFTCGFFCCIGTSVLVWASGNLLLWLFRAIGG